MKKLWVYVLCLLLIGTVALTVFAAANDTKITVTTDKTTVYRGDTVQVTVTMTGTDKFTSMGYLHDNSGKYFTVGKYSTGDALEEEGYPSVCIFSKKDGLLAAGYTDYDTEQDIAVTVNGEILTMNITIAEDAPFESFRITNVVSVRNGREYIAVTLEEPELTVLCKHQYGQWTEAGEGHKQVCETCGDEKTANHAWDDGKVTTEPDCKNDGEKTFTCADCGATKTEVVKATGTHNFTNGVKVDDASHTLTCTGCGDTKTEAHKMDDGKITKAPTCKEEGVQTFSCAACDHTRTEVIPVTDQHDFTDWESLGENQHGRNCPVCQKQETAAHSFTEGTCTDCGLMLEYTVIFADEDGTELSKATYHYGDEVAIPAAPEKAADNTYTYTFAGWDKEVTDCAGDATYTATYTATYIEYTVTFLEENGEVLTVDVYHYGDMIAVPEDRQKEADAFGFYTFAGWGEEILYCQGNVIYTAQFIYTHYPPDFDKTGEVTDADAIYLLRHTLFPDSYDVHLDGDVNCDGKVTDADAVYLLRHTLFPEQYPLYAEKKD